MSGFEFVQRGKVLIVKKQFQDAVKVCRLGLLAHPTLVEGRLVLGMALMALSRYDEVLAEMRVALELDKQSPLGFLLKGEALLRKGDLRQADEVLLRARQLDPLNDKVGSLLDEVKRAKESGGRLGRPIAPPSFKAEATETRMYPAHASEGSAVNDAPPSQANTPPLGAPQPVFRSSPRSNATPTEPRPTQASGQVITQSPAQQLAVGDKSATIVLESRDVTKDDDDESHPDIQRSSVLEIQSRDLEEMSPPAVSVRAMAARGPGDETGTRTLAPAPADLNASFDEDEHSTETLERKRPNLPSASPRAGSPNVIARRKTGLPDVGESDDDDSGDHADNYVIVDLATGAKASPLLPARPGVGPGGEGVTSALDSIESMIEADDYDDPSGLGESAGGDSTARQRRISRAMSAGPPSEPKGMRAPLGRGSRGDAPGDGGPTSLAGPASRRAVPRATPEDDTAQGKFGKGVGFVDDEMESTSPQPVEARRPVDARRQRPSNAPLPAPPEEPLPLPAPLPGVDPWAASPPRPALPPPRPTLPPRPTSAPASASAQGTPGSVATPKRKPGDNTGTTRDRDRLRSSPTATGMVRGLRPLVMGLIAALVVAGAIAAGLVVREQRVKRRIRQLTDNAALLAAAQTYRAYTQAEANYRAILQQRDDVTTRAALARVRAVMAAEFGEPPDEAIALLEGLSGSKSRDVACAQVYVALAKGDSLAAGRAGRDAVAQFPTDAESHYLLGRALYVTDDVTGAANELGESIKLGATPMALIALGVAEQSRGRADAAVAAIDQALALAPGHPAATIERARVLAAANRLPAAGAEPASPEAALTQILRAGAQAEGGEPPVVSRAQLGWASLALAEVKLARGELPAAKGALAAAVESRPGNDRRFVEALFSAYLLAGDTTAARAEAERAVQTWPAEGAPHVWLARVALAEKKAEVALAELDKAGAAGARPEALSIRGQAKLELGDLEGAVRDLDEALAARPDDRGALLARALVDLGRGDPRAAATRAEALYALNQDPEIGVVYGAALRELGDRPKAREVLELAIKSPRGKRGYIELARLHRDEGRWAEAREAYARAIEQAPRAYDARLEAAVLAWDQGDARGARDAVDALVIDAPEEAEVLLECARLHTVTGDLGGAQKCLDGAARLNLMPAARGRHAREKGRLLLLRRDPRGAAAELKRAVVALPEDTDARILLIDASLQLDDRDGVNAVLTEVLKKFSGRAEADLARGRVHVANGAFAQAIDAFLAAGKAMAAGVAPPRQVSDGLAWLGRAYYFNNELAKARASLEEAARLDPSNVEAYFHLGLLLVDQGQLALARAAFQRATDANPGFPDAWFFLGDTSRRLGDRGKAISAYAVYLRLVPKGDYAAEARKFSP